DGARAQRHADVLLDVLGETELPEGGQAALGEGELDRAADLDRFAAQIAAQLVQLDLPAAAGEIDAQERAAETCSDDGDPWCCQSRSSQSEPRNNALAAVLLTHKVSGATET